MRAEGRRTAADTAHIYKGRDGDVSKVDELLIGADTPSKFAQLVFDWRRSSHFVIGPEAAAGAEEEGIEAAPQKRRSCGGERPSKMLKRRRTAGTSSISTPRAAYGVFFRRRR